MKIAPPIGCQVATITASCERQGAKISVIVPVLNEAAVIEATLRCIPAGEDIEVIVVDGGSRDSSVRVAEAFGARVIHTTAGRAHQMNLGAAAAHGEVLLFLHADTCLPADFLRLVDSTLRRPGVIAGAFRLRIDSRGWSLRIVEAMANFRSRWLGMPYGDQALFVPRHHFRTAAGFSKLPIMEDFEFVRRLKRWGRIALAPATVLTSARRWERLGVLRATLLNQAIILAYLFGVSPARLASWYRGGVLASRESPQDADTRKRPVSMAPTLPSAHEH